MTGTYTDPVLLYPCCGCLDGQSTFSDYTWASLCFCKYIFNCDTTFNCSLSHFFVFFALKQWLRTHKKSGPKRKKHSIPVAMTTSSACVLSSAPIAQTNVQHVIWHKEMVHKLECSHHTIHPVKQPNHNRPLVNAQQPSPFEKETK